MKSIKRLFSLVITLALLISLAACGSKTTRNTTVPYGSLNLDTIVAQSNDKDIELKLSDYYNRLRAKGYDIFTTELKMMMYEDEFSALKALLSSDSMSDLTSDELKTLSYKAFKDGSISTTDEYEELKELYIEELSTSILSSVFSTTDTYTINSKTDKERETSINKYIDTMLRKGYTITKDNISYSDLDEDGTADLDITKIPEEIIDSLLIAKAEDLYAQKALYKIADLEYLEDDEKNNNYLFKESSIISTYDSSYKTFGNYKAIIITYNSRREAMENIKILGDKDITAEDYITLYNAYYSCYGTQNIDSDLFNYTVSLEENELDDISSSVNTLITETLEDGEYLTEPRNLDGKYVLAYRISTTYDYNEVEYEDLDEDTKAEVTELIQKNLIRANSSSYTSTAFKEIIENNNLEIYDPLYEYKFRNSYTDYYDLIDVDNENIGKNAIFKFNDKEFSVEDFYTKASSTYASTIITEYFQQEYTLKYLDEFVDEDTQESNESTLNSAIKDFNKDKNSSYPKEIGLETYLLAAYGYPTKEQVLKYYYNAKTCMSSYKAKVLFDEWATDDHKISDEASKVLNRILEIGNASYDTLFNINVDHVLINIDYDADGTPDDPQKFISENPNIKDLFESEIQKLAQAIYTEAINEAYSDNTLYETLAYIVKQFNKGATLESNPNDNWDNYKTHFNFIITAEQLASSGDITQDSVSNFVVPFADYIKDMYQLAADTEDLKIEDNGNFFTPTDGKLASVSDATKITTETLCQTVYGYHLIVLNSYSGPDSLSFTEDNDSNGYQSNIQVLISEDEDDETNNVYVELDSYNTNKNEANLNQLFIYYVETKNGADSSLDSNISTLLSTLFTDAITMYSSSNFQTMVLLDEINITSNDEKLATLIEMERNYYANLVISYDNESEYISWIDKDMDWSRPNQK